MGELETEAFRLPPGLQNPRDYFGSRGELAFGRGGGRHDRDGHNSNAELVAQGVANLVVPLAGGTPVTGAIARSATNFRSGGRTPVAGIIHAVTVAAILVALAPLARFVPLPTLAAVLFLVAYNMGEWREIPSIMRSLPISRSGF